MAREEPGTLRPGGRTARVRAAVLRAAGDMLAERSFAHLDLAEVARRAGVGRTTVYRRWRTVPALVADLFEELAGQTFPRIETGTLSGDLVAYARLVLRTLTEPRQGPLLTAAIAVAAGDERTAAALRRFHDTRITEWAECVPRAVERGEVPAGTDGHEVIQAVAAPLYHRLLVTGGLLTDAVAVRAAESAVAAAKAGVFVRH